MTLYIFQPMYMDRDRNGGIVCLIRQPLALGRWRGQARRRRKDVIGCGGRGGGGGRRALVSGIPRIHVQNTKNGNLL